MRLAAFVCAVIVGLEAGVFAADPTINPELLSSRWSAHWIRPEGATSKGFGVYHFRKHLTLDAKPDRFVVHVSGDNRYELFVNGTRVLMGPARGDLSHWRFETADIAPHLRAGDNVFAAVVWNFADEAPMAQVTYQTGFILQGDGPAEQAASTNRSWKAVTSDAISLVPIDRAAIFHQYFAAGTGEQVDASRYPWGWETREFDDSRWGAVQEVSIGGPRAIRDSPSRWFLVPTPLPPQESRLDRFSKVARADGGAPGDGWLEGRRAWTIPAGATVRVLLDRGELTTAYPEIVTSGGRGASIALTYAEALLIPHADGKRGEKGNRSDIAGKTIGGLRDRFLPDGGQSRLFRPLWWRTYRYVEAEIRTAGEPLTIEDIRGDFTAYPFEQRGSFESSDPTLQRIWDVGWRTARLCAHETYMDTPYWEQLQYIGDTRIQALISLYVGGDDRLVRNAIAQFDESRIPDGLTQSRYPTMLPQIIPPFSLFWVGMMHDFYAYGGDEAFARKYLGGARGVLDWFEARLAPSGLLGRLEWWNFADWVDGQGFGNGEPPTDNGGESAIVSLQFVLALREAADLEQAVGSPDQAARYRAVADRVAAAIKRATWDESRRFYADTPGKRTRSQHVNALAVLADLVPKEEQAAFMRRVLDDRTLTQATYYFRFYLFRAMTHAGLGDAYLDQLAPWRQMLDLGLTTWAEEPDPTRSDSHAWSAHPNFDLLTTVAGIQPAAPGFSRIRIEPHLGTITSVKAAVPTPRGMVSVKYTRTGGALTAEITLPRGTSGVFAWQATTSELREGTQTITR